MVGGWIVQKGERHERGRGTSVEDKVSKLNFDSYEMEKFRN